MSSFLTLSNLMGICDNMVLSSFSLLLFIV